MLSFYIRDTIVFCFFMNSRTMRIPFAFLSCSVYIQQFSSSYSVLNDEGKETKECKEQARYDPPTQKPCDASTRAVMSCLHPFLQHSIPFCNFLNMKLSAALTRKPTSYPAFMGINSTRLFVYAVYRSRIFQTFKVRQVISSWNKISTREKDL